MAILCRATIASIALGWATLVASAPDSVRAEQRADCGYRDVAVVYDDPAELDMACQALSDVLGYFRDIGFAILPKLSLRFAERSSGQVLTHGYFDGARSQSVVDRRSNVSPWGLQWTAELSGSFVRHELVHMAIWEILGGSPARLRREWHEFMAYAIQLDLMGSDLRRRVLAAQAQTPAFASLMQVNEFTSQMAPHAFAVGAYKTYLANGQEKFTAQLLRGEVVPPTVSYPFPVLPGQ
jgi:hypothetical protein